MHIWIWVVSSICYLYCENIIVFLNGLITFIGTVSLGVATMVQQKKFKKISDEKDSKYQEYIKEEHRLSFLPYLISTKDCVYNVNNLNNDLKEAIAINCDKSELLGSSSVFSSLNVIGSKYVLLKYVIKNIGRDSAIDISLVVNNKDVCIFNLHKGEEKDIKLFFEIYDDKNIFSINLKYKSLDNHLYTQTEDIKFYNINAEKNIECDWSIEETSLTSPIIKGDD